MHTSILIHPDELTEKWVDRMVSHGIHTLGIHPVGGKQAAHSLRELLALQETAHFRQLIDYARDKGLTVTYPLHAMSYLLDRSLFAAHPDWFRMDENGNRTQDRNLCPSHPQALSRVADAAAQLADSLYRSEERYHFWLDDSRKGRCHCPRCRALSDSDQQLTVVNAMLAGIRRSRPQAKLSYLAYFDALQLPTQVQPAEGVFLEYAPFDKWNYICTPAPHFAVGAALEEKMLLPLLNFFGRKDATVLEYWIDNSLFSGWKKPPVRLDCTKTDIRADIARYLSAGYEHICVFGCYLGPDYEARYGEPDITPLTDALANTNM